MLISGAFSCCSLYLYPPEKNQVDKGCRFYQG